MPTEAPVKGTKAARNIRRSAWPVWVDSPDEGRDRSLSLSTALLATLVVHGLLFFAVPWDRIEFSNLPDPVSNPPVEIVLEPYVEEEPPRFVETNPEVAPPETPPDTHHFAAMDQVAADEVAEATPDNLPATDGESPESQKIVEGDVITEEEPYTPEGMILPPSESLRPTRQPDYQTAAESAPEEVVINEPVRQEASQAPLDRVEQVPETEEGVASIERAGDSPVAVETPEDRTQRFQPTDRVEVQLEEQVQTVASASGQPTPQPRPRLNFKTPPGPVMKNPGSASTMGLVAIDARFSEFGGYTQRMLEAISAQWYLLGNQSLYLSGEMGTYVVVEFTLNSDGHVSGLKVLHTSSGRPATLLVQDAILSRAPFGKWTRDMVQTLGEAQDVRITFNYR